MVRFIHSFELVAIITSVAPINVRKPCNVLTMKNRLLTMNIHYRQKLAVFGEELQILAKYYIYDEMLRHRIEKHDISP